SVVAGVRLAAVRAVLAGKELGHDVLERHALRDRGSHLAMLDPDRVLGTQPVTGSDHRRLLAHGAEIGAVEPALLEEPAAALVGDPDEVEIVVEALQLIVGDGHASSSNECRARPRIEVANTRNQSRLRYHTKDSLPMGIEPP